MITPYSATVYCGLLSNTWTYSGLDIGQGQLIEDTSDSISINPASGVITVGLAKPAGIFKIKVIGTLPNNY